MDGDLAEAKAIAAVVGEKYCSDGERELTVQKTSHFYPGDGYAAYDHQTGDLVFRVDTYGHGRCLADNIVLMDMAGDPILTVHRKWLSLHQKWEGFLGEKKDGEKQRPLFSVKKSSMFGGNRNTIDVETHDGDGDKEFRVEGNFAQRSCRVVMCSGGGGGGQLGDDEHVVAEIKRKVNACSGVVLGKEVLCLSLRPRFDAAFAMGIVLVLDQISVTEDDTTAARRIDAAAIATSDDDDRPNK